METYEEWDVTIPPLPPRSRLYCLEPIGIGTPYVESLTSYIVRLAKEHHISLKLLVIQEVLPFLDKENLTNENPHIHQLWHRDALVLNGTDFYAKAWVDALAQLTFWESFSPLTMLSWQDVISRKGLLRPTQAWCPACYEDWRGNNTDIYNPLLWALQAVDVCPRHHLYLQTLCPHEDCRRPLPYFSPRSRVGFCPFCMRWLGNPFQAGTSNCCDAVSTEEIGQRYWISKSVGELIEAAPNLSVPPSKYQLALFLTQCSNQLADGSLKLLARQLKVPFHTLLAWQQGANTPRLDTLSKVGYAIGVPLRSILVDTQHDWSQYSNIHPIRRRRHKDVAHEDVCRTLRDFLSLNPPLSVKEIAVKLGYNSSNYLYRCSSELCRAITARYQDWYKDSSVSRPGRQSVESEENIRKVLEEILMSDVYPLPSIRQIGKRLGYRDGTTLHQRFPELCKAILEKRQQQLRDDPLKQKLEGMLSDDSYPPLSLREVAEYLGCPAEHLYNRFPILCSAIVKRHNQLFDSDALRGKLEAALLDDVTPPPSVQELAKEFGFGVARLRRHFPDLCREIAQKYQEYRKNQRILRLQHIYDDVKDAILRLQAEGRYPSLRNVRNALKDKKYWSKDVNDAWRKIMLELHLGHLRNPNL